MDRQRDWKRHQLGHHQQQQMLQKMNPFVKRVMEIPIVKSTSDSVVSEYNKVKKSNGLIGGVLEKAEDVVLFAEQTFVQPAMKLVQRPVNAISKSADRQLEYFQKLYPPINYTPKHMKKAYHELTLKDIFVFLVSLPMLIFAVVYGWTMEVITIIKDAIKAVWSYCMGTLHGIQPRKPLDWVDQYIVGPVVRLIAMIGYCIFAIGFYLVTAIWAIFTWIADTISKLFHGTTDTVSAGVLFTAKASTNVTAGVADRAISIVSPYLPESTQKPTASLLSYIHHWQEVVDNASSIEEVGKAVMEETKQNVQLAKQANNNKPLDWIFDHVINPAIYIVGLALMLLITTPYFIFVSIVQAMRDVFDGIKGKASSVEEVGKAVIEETEQNVRLAKQANNNNKPLDWIFYHVVNPVIYIVGLFLMLLITTPYFIFVSIVQAVCQVFDWIKGKASSIEEVGKAVIEDTKQNVRLAKQPNDNKPLDWIFDHVINPVIYIVGLVLMLLVTTPYFIFVSIVQALRDVFDWTKGKASAGVLFTGKASTNVAAGVADRVISIVSPYLPDSTHKPTASLLSYISHWQEVVDNASSIEEIVKAVIEETKQNVRLAKQIIQTILNNNDHHKNHDENESDEERMKFVKENKKW